MDDDYRPRSPDLSAAPYESYDEPIHPQHQQYRGSISHVSPYTPITPVGAPAESYFARQANISQPAWQQPQYNAFQPQSPQQFQQQPIPQIPQQPSYMPRALAVKPDIKSESMDEDYEPARRGRGRGSGPKKAKEEVHEEEMMAESNFHGPEIRTKFPVARIKRIMQADEDVGKVAQVTPIVVSRALELFMTALITKSAEEARTRGSKRVLPAHLKQAVKANEQFDFLSDIVEKVPDAPPPSQRKGLGGDADSEDEGRKKRPGRRKKSEMSE